MSAIRNLISPSSASRVAKFRDAVARSDERIADLISAGERAEAQLAETADPAPMIAAENALASEKSARAALVRGLEDAEEAEREAARADAAARHEAEQAELQLQGASEYAETLRLGTAFAASLSRLHSVAGRLDGGGSPLWDRRAVGEKIGILIVST